ncbi:MAG: SpoIVB peptidase S55 domain-containing protein [Atribacterota bacterium]
MQKGMEAVGKTVFHGTKVEEFKVEVIDVVRSKDIRDSYFVVRVEDQRVKSLGGISAGMSGSPVYIKGKIAGALAYNWETQDNLVGVVTPIEAMLSIWKEEETLAPLDGLESSVVFLRGFRGRAGELLAKTLRDEFALRTIFTLPSFIFGGREKEKSEAPLQPGSAIGIQLLTGDAEIMSIGTLTFRDGERILALGHPFLHRGKASYFLSSVYVNFSLKGEDFPFKVGTSLETVGMIDQDRGVGVSGRIGTLPEGSEVTIVVRGGSKRGEYHYLSVRDSSILLEVIPKVILDSIDRTIDSQVPGSGNVVLKMGKGDFTLREEFFVLSDSDIGNAIADSMGKVLEVVLANPYQDVTPEKMELTIEIFPDLQKGWLLSAEFPRIVKREEPAEGRINFFLYRQGERAIAFPLTIPADFSAGEAEVLVQGRGIGEETPPPSGTLPPTLSEYLRNWFEEFRRNGIKVEVIAKMGSSENRQVYFSQNIYLPVILEGNFSAKVWIN